MEIKRKVLAYITKGENDDRKILVFEQKDHPEAGLQVPGGTIEEDELLIDALYREIEEETGLHREQLELKGKVNKRNYFPENREDVIHERNIFHLSFTGEGIEEWDNEVHSTGKDDGLIFH
ncbi:NUDIX hydrolase [Sporosarcina sp. USHLN248]